MKPMKVEAGKFAPDIDEAIQKANEMIAKVDKETKEFGSEHADLFSEVTGVEPVKTGYYDTNQRMIKVEDKKKTAPKKEEVKFKNANPHENALEAHENKAGDSSDKNPQGAYNLTDYL